jgi:hypothetical protein
VSGQPIRQINVKIIHLGVRIIPGPKCNWTIPVVNQKDDKFQKKCPNTKPKPKADLVGDCCIKKVNQYDIEKNPDAGVEEFDLDQFSIP